MMRTISSLGPRALALSAALLGAIGSTGCKNVQTDFCDAVCECQNCGEKGQERCDINVQGQLDTAEVYGCLSQAEAFFDCVIDASSCNDGEFDPRTESCEDERQDYDECTRDSSRRDPGPY